MSGGGAEIRGPVAGRHAEVLTAEAVAFLAGLHRAFDARRRELLAARAARQAAFDKGELPRFLDQTRAVREGDWKVPKAPADLADRRVEITGPVERKMMINALNSGARVFMADFEDANSPTWANNLDGQVNLIDAVRRRIEHVNPDGKVYRLNDKVATLVVRPRGWHLVERGLVVDGAPVSASLFDFGLHFFHSAKELVARGSGPYYYLPKLESHLEARLWNDVFVAAQARLGLPTGTVRATVLIETILAAFEMDEILHALGPHATGLNAGRWDYIFSIIKRFRNRPDMLLPDRSQVTMAVPFMRSYTELLVKTCHRRGAHAIGGMAAFIPSRKDAAVNEAALSKVREDKVRESAAGFDGTWVAHPDLVPVAAAVFDAAFGDRHDQLDRLRDDVGAAPQGLLELQVKGGAITDAGVRTNVSVGIQYIESWLRGVGAAAIHNLMEDAATAEISRSQLWQWARHGARTDEGHRIDAAYVRRVIDEECAKLRAALGAEAYDARPFAAARKVFEDVSMPPGFPEFLTIPAYDLLAPQDGRS